MRNLWIFVLSWTALLFTVDVASACPTGVAGVAEPNSTVCAEAADGTLYCHQADAAGDFFIYAGAVPPSTGGCLPTGGTYWFYQVGCYDDGMSVNRGIASERYGGPWLDVTCEPEPVHEPKLCLLATDWVPGNISNLWDVNGGTGAVYNPRPTGLNHVVGIALHPSNTRLYAVTSLGTNPSTNSLYEIDIDTGASTLIGPLGIGGLFEGDLAFGDDGTLYGIMSTKLYTIDTVTGAATVVGNPFGSDYSFLSFNGSGTLYGIDNSSTPGQVPTNLDEINPGSGSVVASQTITELGGYGGMDWYQVGGWMWVADGQDPGSVYAGHRKLFRLNPVSGALTAVGSLGLSHGVTGLAACKPCAVETALDDEETHSSLSNREVLSMAYRVRDELLETSRIGVHYKDTFYNHSLRMVYLMARDKSLRLETTSFLHRMAPGFLDLLDRGGRNERVDNSMVESARRLANRYVEADRSRGGRSLADAIERELQRVDLDRLLNLSFADAWAYLNTLATDGGQAPQRFTQSD